MPTALPLIIHLRFHQALVIVRSIPEQEVGLQPIPTERLQFYGLYKHAVHGKCNISKPSSRNIVKYAKWKAWHRARFYSCMEAKYMYVNLLVDLLVDFINRYPNSPHHEFAHQALHSLESEGTDAREAPSSIPANSLTMTLPSPNHITSPSSSWFSKSPSLQASSTPSSITAHDKNAPRTPTSTTTPQQRHCHLTSMGSDLTTPVERKDTSRKYTMSEQPFIPSPSPPSKNRQKVATHHHHHHHHHRQQQKDKRQVSPSSPERKMLEKLCLGMAALAEQMNLLGQLVVVSHDGPRIKRHNGMIKLGRHLVKTLRRHLLMNTLATGFVFWMLWHQLSPSMHAMVDFLTPFIKPLIRSFAQKMMIWKQKDVGR